MPWRHVSTFTIPGLMSAVIALQKSVGKLQPELAILVVPMHLCMRAVTVLL